MQNTQIHGTVITRSDALHNLTITVIAGDVDAGLGQFIFDLHVGHEDHPAAGNQAGCHLIQDDLFWEQ